MLHPHLLVLRREYDDIVLQFQHHFTLKSYFVSLKLKLQDECLEETLDSKYTFQWDIF